ncbi:MAG: HEAT repeat domain-containing protein [Elusimicrobia bacterium]|nr:HEAT repeat domain-containing protein [Elusimicrobiota bacterium]
MDIILWWTAKIIGGAIILGIGFLAVSKIIRHGRLADVRKKQQKFDLLLDQISRTSPERLASIIYEIKKSFPPNLLKQLLENKLDDPAAQKPPSLVKAFELFGILQDYIRDLHESPRWIERAQAAKRLGTLGHPNAVLPLIGAVSNPAEEREVKNIAIKSLGLIHDPRAIGHLIDALAGDDQGISQLLSDALIQFGAQAVPSLIKTADESKNENQRFWAIRILGALKAAECETQFMAALEDHSHKIREAAAEALGCVKAGRAVGNLRDRLFHDPVIGVRQKAAEALGKIEDQAAFEALGAGLAELNEETRSQATQALVSMGPKAAPIFLEVLARGDAKSAALAASGLDRIGFADELIEQLIKPGQEKPAYDLLVSIARLGCLDTLARSLKNKPAAIRLIICRIFEEAKNSKRAEALLEAASSDSETEVRLAAAEALAAARETKALPVILRNAKDASPENRALLLEKLAVFSGENLSPLAADLIEYVQDRNPSVRQAAVRLISVIMTDKTLDALIRCLSDSDPLVRLAAAEALGSRGGPGPQSEAGQKTAQALIGLFRDPVVSVRTAAVKSLGSFGWPDNLLPLCLAFAQAKEIACRDAISEAIAKIPPDVIFERLAGLPIKEPESRAGIAWTLGLIGDKKGYSLLMDLLKDKEPMVRAAAAGGLGNFKSPETVLILADYIEDPNERVRAAVVNAVAKSNDPDAADLLSPRLNDPDPFVQKRAVLAMGILAGRKPEENRPIFKTQIKNWRKSENKDLSSQAAALIALALIEDKASFAECLEALHHKELSTHLRGLLRTIPLEARRRFFDCLSLDMDLYFSSQGAPEQTRRHYKELLVSSRKPLDRMRAMEALELLGGEGLSVYLENAFAADPAAEIRAKALEMLARTAGGPKFLEKISRAVRDPSEFVRNQAVSLFKELNPRDLLESRRLLMPLLESSSPRVREAASELAARVFENRGHELKELILKGGSKNLALGVLAAIGRMGSSDCQDVLMRFTSDKDPEIRSCAVYWAVQNNLLNKKELMAHLDDPQEAVRTAAIKGLGILLDSEALDCLASASQDPSPLVRREVAAVLGQKKLTEETRPRQILEKLIKDQHWEVKAQSFLSLFQMGSHEVADLAAEAIKELPKAGREDFIRYLEKRGIIFSLEETVKNDADAAKRVEALKILGAVDPARFRPILLAALSDPSPEVRAQAVRLLASDENTEAQKAIDAMAADPSETVRTAVKWARLRIE